MKINKIKLPSIYLILIPLSLFLVIAFTWMVLVGLNYDESIFISAALGGIDDDFVFKKIFGIPFMVLPDQGVIKSYLYYPIFKLFGVNIFSIRVPIVFLSILALIVWFKIIKKVLSDDYWPLIFVTLMAMDPAFILHATIDTSPFVLQNLFMALAIYFYLCSFEQNSLLYFGLSAISMILGLLNKINFLWFIVPFGYVIFLYHSKQIYTLYDKYRIKLIALLALFFLILGLIVVFLVIPPALHFPLGGMTHVGLYKKILYVIELYLDTFNGAARYQRIFYKNIAVYSIVNWIEIIFILLWLVSIAYVRLKKISNDTYQHHKKHILFFLMLFVIEFLFVLFTPNTYHPGHIMMLWPLPHLLFILMIVTISSLFPRNIIFLIVPELVVMVVILSQCFVNIEYIFAFKNPKMHINYNWSPTIYRLSDYVNQHMDAFDNVILLDFDMRTQLFALANNNKDRLKIHEIWLFFTDADTIKKSAYFMHPIYAEKEIMNQQIAYAQYFKGKRNLLIMYTTMEMMHHAKQGFYDFAEQHGIKLIPEAIINDANGNPVYSLFSHVFLGETLVADVFLSVVIPIKNEQELLWQNTSILANLLDQLIGQEQWQFILVNNNSTDHSQLVIDKVIAKWPPSKTIFEMRRGYSASLRAGLSQVSTPYVLIVDIEQWDIPFIVYAWNHREKYDLHLGSKRANPKICQQPFLRMLLSCGLNILLRLLFCFKGTDTHGQKFIRMKSMKYIITNCVSDRGLYDTEMVLRAYRYGYSIAESAVAFSELRPARNSIFNKIVWNVLAIIKLYRIMYKIPFTSVARYEQISREEILSFYTQVIKTKGFHMVS